MSVRTVSLFLASTFLGSSLHAGIIATVDFTPGNESITFTGEDTGDTVFDPCFRK